MDTIDAAEASPVEASTDRPKHRIRTEGLVRNFGRKSVVRGVDIEVGAGEVVGLLGPNGAGKTTTFYMVVGLIAATEGRVFYDDRDITRLPMYRRSRLGIGYLPQEPSIFRKLTVRQNLQAIAETLSLPRKKRQDIVEHQLDELGLNNVANQRAYTLSGGERRRLEISRALVTTPSFLLMDEPFSGVDPISVSEVQEIVLRLRDRGIGILITDHNVRETLRIVDRAYLLYEGKVMSQGDGETLLNDPNSRKFYLGDSFDL